MTIAQPPLRRTLIAFTTAAVLALAGCGDDDTTSDSTGPESSSSEAGSPSQSSEASPGKSTSSGTTVAVSIDGAEVSPLAKTVELGVGETLGLDISSDRVGELHVHATPEKELNFDAGSTHLEVTFDQPGSVDIEEHESGALVVRVLVK